MKRRERKWGEREIREEKKKSNNRKGKRGEILKE